jgi:hypothetical protein
MTCGLVWVCPVCAAKVQSVRAAEVRRAIDLWTSQGGLVLLLTLTVPHTRQDALEDVLSRFNEGFRHLMRGKPWERLKAAHGLSGHVKALELTWGESNGWHPHAHVLLFLDAPGGVYDLDTHLWERWQSATTRAGFGSLSLRGFNLQDGSAVRNYVTKMGTEYTWGAEHELVKAHTKRGRGSERFTPFDFLRRYLEAPDDGRLLYLFGEFAAVFRGRNQLVWSRGWKRHLLGSDGLTDEQAASSIGEFDPVLARITHADWSLIRRHNLRGQVLQTVQQFGSEGLGHLLEHLRSISQPSSDPRQASAPSKGRGVLPLSV